MDTADIYGKTEILDRKLSSVFAFMAMKKYVHFYDAQHCAFMHACRTMCIMEVWVMRIKGRAL